MSDSRRALPWKPLGALVIPESVSTRCDSEEPANGPGGCQPAFPATPQSGARQSRGRCLSRSVLDEGSIPSRLSKSHTATFRSDNLLRFTRITPVLTSPYGFDNLDDKHLRIIRCHSWEADFTRPIETPFPICPRHRSTVVQRPPPHGGIGAQGRRRSRCDEADCAPAVDARRGAVMDPFLTAAFDEARKGRQEGGIPVGSVLVYRGAILGRGHNRRVQRGSPILHAEMDALENAGRRAAKVYR